MSEGLALTIKALRAHYRP